MTEKESVEALAKRIAEWVWTHSDSLDSRTQCIKGITPILANWQPTEKQQPADDAHRERVKLPFNLSQEWLRKCGVPPPQPAQPAEPVVTDGDRELAIAVASYCIAGVLPPVDLREVARIIAKARQAEREELRRLRMSLRDTEDQLVQVAGKLEAKCGEGVPMQVRGDTLADACCRKIDAHQAKLTAAEAELESLATMRAAICIQNENYEKMRQRLTAAEARVRELEQQLQLHAIDASRVANEAAEAYRRAKNVLHNYRIDATADAKRGSDERED